MIFKLTRPIQSLLFFANCVYLANCTPKPEPFILGILALPVLAETAAFQVSSTVPTANQTDVSTSSSVIITFNKDIDSTSISGNISLTQPATNSISSLTASTSAKILTIRPSSAFNASSSYTITIKAAVKSTSAETLGTDFPLTFTTQ